MYSSSFTVIYDACALYGAFDRDILMSVACGRLFRAKWSQEISDEWMTHLVANSDGRITAEQVGGILLDMQEALPDALVEGYEDLIAGLSLPDKDDRHVLAAAIRCGAQAIITWNIRDFPADHLSPFGIAACTPDDFWYTSVTVADDEA